MVKITTRVGLRSLQREAERQAAFYHTRDGELAHLWANIADIASEAIEHERLLVLSVSFFNAPNIVPMP